MKSPPRTWPDGRPVGGENGYPPEYREWGIECQCRHVAKEMRQGRNKAARGAIFDEWQKILPGISKARVAEIWRDERNQGRR